VPGNEYVHSGIPGNEKKGSGGNEFAIYVVNTQWRCKQETCFRAWRSQHDGLWPSQCEPAPFYALFTWLQIDVNTPHLKPSQTGHYSI